ncbi:MAG: hypothetical protein H6832_07065 [Planctomycetes bacterium]|nr:hypothetical protein [Planctomycetota bacterium]MCB9890330.1 hypothetical protein [Planctomycetota bacterium]MCB9918148.1 hypothetical protein [Planctomycetota bacterium]
MNSIPTCRLLTSAALALGLCLGSIGCGGSESGGNEGGNAAGTNAAGDGNSSDVEQGGLEGRPHAADAGDTLTIALIGDADSMLPMVGQSVNGSMVYDLLVPPATTSDFENGRIIFNPGLAKSYSWNDDHTELTYELKDDCYWDDDSGKVVNAEDIRYNYELIADPDVKSPRQNHVERLDPKNPVEVLDNFRVRFHFQYAYNEQTMLAHAGFNISPKHLLEKLDRASLISCDLSKKRAVGHGPFRFLKWDPKQSITIVRNPKSKTYAVPYVKRIVFKIIPEYQTRLVELKKGDIDMMDAVQEKDIEEVLSWGTVKLYERGYRFLDYVAWNMQNPLFAERDARRALTLAIDIERIIKTILTFGGKTYGTKAYSTFTPELSDYRVDDITLLPHDPTKAKTLLAGLGWKDTDNDGFLDKDGKRFEFVLVTNQGNPRRSDACVLIQEDLKKIGIKVNLEQREGVTFFDDLSKKNYEAALAGWSASLFPDPSDVWGSATETENRLFNFTAYSNARVDELIAKGLRTKDGAEEAKIWQEMQRIIYEDQPYTFLYWKTSTVPLHKRFRDYKPNVLSVLHGIENVWVPKAEQKSKH